ncbi:hypothetical protein OX284_001020 [Flavobacterium sp. SUN046]|uniref:hypothetical protein n=1 Tax=Flavobacterium sp. SUN046 TaxID=3002440 RepID=UPI002DB8AC64|nr:hypothetical protein [Flavobacterium sp. SUN046]MEC4047995.1 hypothetical protein [Flavobacterium sp. SUN046]
MRNYLEKTDEKLVLQMDNFSSKIGIYAPQFGLTPEEVTNIINDSRSFTWVVSSSERVDTYKKNWTLYKTNVKKGNFNLETNQGPAPLVFDVAPTVVAPGILNRFTSLVVRIKAHPSYSKAIGLNLGIEVSASRPYLNVENAKPILKATLRVGKVHLQWKKGDFHGIAIEKDTGKGFVSFDKDFNPNYVDNSPMPPLGESAVWRYRAAYLLNDELVGQWSDIVTISVNA